MVLKRENSCLIIANVQKDLVTILRQGQKLIDDCCWLVELAKSLDVPVIVLEHKGLGPTVESIKKLTPSDPYIEIVKFSCFQDKQCMSAIDALGKKNYLLAGAEPHITLMQTASDFIQDGRKVSVVANAVSARSTEDTDLSFPRFQNLGAELVSKEMVFFEWIKYSEYPEYINLSMKFLDGRYLRM